MYKTDSLEISQKDNMELMAMYPDGYFDLAVVDPPYGMIKNTYGSESKGVKAKFDCNIKNHREWDFAPSEEYFNELQRVSKNKIIWGANHLGMMPSSSCWIVWNKENSGDFADCELAYTSFKTAVRMFSFCWNGMIQGDMKNKEIRIHPTQKPVKLYEWIFKNYAKPGDKILDTHLGSGSIAIALDRMNKIEGMNLHLTACELDEDYYKAAIKRISAQTRQTAISL